MYQSVMKKNSSARKYMGSLDINIALKCPLKALIQLK